MRNHIMLLLVGILLISNVSALFASVDNPAFDKDFTVGTKKIIEKELWAKYPPIEIKNWFGIGETLATGAIEKHTETCGTNCESIFTLAITKDSVLVNDITFWTMDALGTTRVKEENIKSHSFHYLTSSSPHTVEDYGFVCVPTTYLNGSNSNVCTKQVTGSHIEYVETWELYTIGTEMPAGTYTLRLTGEKVAQRAVDWVIQTQGEWLNEWSTWGTGNYGTPLTDISIAYTSSSPAQCDGIQITAVKNATIKNVTKDGSSTATGCKLISDYAGTLLDSGTFVGNVCKLNSNFTLRPNTNYVVCGSGGDGRYANGVSPQVGTNLNFTGFGCYGNTANTCDNPISGQPRNIVSITSQEFTNGSLITLIAVADNYATQTLTISPFNASATVVGATLVNMSYWDNSTGIFTRNKTQTLTGASNGTNFTQVFQASGFYKWGIQACDTDGACGMSENRTLSIDTSAPFVTIIHPVNNSNYYVFSSPANVTLNVSIVDANLQTCIFFNTTQNVTFSCTQNASVMLSQGRRVLEVYANDTTGLFGSSSTNFTVNYLIPLVNYSVGIEGSNSTIQFNLTATSISTLNVTLSYNNTLYIMAGTFNSTFGSFSVNVTAPIVTANTNVPLFVNYTINGQSIVTNTTNQTIFTVTNLIVNTSCVTPAITFTSQDEQNLTTIPIDVNYNFKFGAGTLNSTFRTVNGSLTGVTNFSVCINTTIASNWTLGYGEVQYTATNGAYVSRRFYTFSNLNLNNVTRLFNLFDLESVSATPFQFQIKDNSLIPIPNVYLTLMRWYPQLNAYNIVEMANTDSDGNTIMSVKTLDTDYRVGVYRTDGTLLHIINPTRMICTVNPCTYPIFVDENPIDLTSYVGVQVNLSYNNNTKLFTLLWNDPAQVTTAMNLTVTQERGNSVTPVCSTRATGFTGVLTCDISAYTTGTFKAVVYRSASPQQFIASIITQLDLGLIGTNKTFALFLAMILACAGLLIGIYNPLLAIGLTVVALIPAVYVGSISLTVFIGFCLLGGIVVFIMRRQ